MGWRYWTKAVVPISPKDAVQTSRFPFPFPFHVLHVQWQYYVALALFAVLAVFVCKRLVARLVAGLLSRDGLDVKIEVVSLAKIKKLDLRLRTNVFGIRVRAKELSINRVRLLQTLSEACVGKFRDNSFKIPVRITGLQVSLDQTHETVGESKGGKASVAAGAIPVPTEGKTNPTMGYYTIYLSRFVIFLASLFRVDIESLTLQLSHSDKRAEVDMDQICILSQQSNPVLSIQTLSMKIFQCSEEKAVVALCETRLDSLYVKASNLEVLPSVLKYSEVDVSVNTIDLAHTNQYEILAPLLDTYNSKAEGKDRNSQGSALMMYAPNHLNLALSKTSIGTLGSNSKDPTHKLLIVALSVALTHKESVQGVPNLFGSSASNFRYTWRLLVKSNRIEMHLQHDLSDLCSVRFKDLKSITTSVCAGHEVQNLVINFDEVEARARPIEEKTLKAVEEILRKLDWKERNKHEGAPSSPDSSLDVQLAINSVGFSLESPKQGRMLMANAPNVSIKLKKKSEAFVSQIYCKNLCASITNEKCDSFSNPEWDTTNTACTQEFITLGKLKVATDFSEFGQKGFVLDTDLGITGCKVELTQQSLVVAGIFDEYVCPWISVFQGHEGRESAQSTTVNFHLQASDASLQYLPIRSQGVLCRVDTLSFNTIQENVSNLHVKTCTVCMASKSATLSDTESFELVHLVSIEDVTLTESSLMSDDGLQAAYKIWCTKIKVEADRNSFEFLVTFTDGVGKDLGYISSLQTFEPYFSAEKSTSINPLFDVQMRKADITLSSDNSDWKLSIRKLIMKEEYKCYSNSIRLSVEGEEIVRFNGMDLEAIQNFGHLESKSAEKGYEIALAIKQLHGRLPDKIQVGDSFQKLASVCEKFQRDLRGVFGIHRSDVNIGYRYNVSVNVLEWDVEVENSKFETWLASHKALLQECHYGVHLLDDIKSESDISVFDYFSPVKEEIPKQTEKEKESHYLYNHVMRSYIRGCRQIDSNTRLYKNVLRCKGNGVHVKFRLDEIKKEDISQSLKGLEGNKVIVKHKSFFVIDFDLEFREIIATLCNMNDPFLHVRNLQVAFAKQKNPDALISLCEKDYDCAGSEFQFFGDVLIQIEHCKGMYGVAMEPYFATIGREVLRLSSPSRGMEKKRGSLLETFNRLFFGELRFCLKSLEGKLLAEPQLPGDVENQNCFHVFLEDFELVPSKNQLGVSLSCHNFEVEASYKFHTGDTLESYLEYERIPIFKSPVFQFKLSLIWNGQLAAREGDEPEKGPNPLKNTIDVSILFNENNEEECPIIFAGEKQIKSLANIICALKDPPDVLRDSFGRKPFGRFEDKQKSSKFVEMLDGLNFEIASRPLKLRYWDPLPNASGHTATIDVDDYTLDMVFCYTDLCKKYENAKLRRIPKLKEIRIYGEDIVFSVKDDNSGNPQEEVHQEEVTSSQVEEKIATLLGNPVGLKSAGLQDKKSLVMQVRSIDVSNKKSEEELLSRTPFQIEISHPKALLDTLKRDVLYTCIATVANAISDVLNEHKGEDSQFQPAGAAQEESSPEEIEVTGSKEAPQDLLSILLQSQRGQLSSTAAGQKDHRGGSRQVDLNFIIEAIQPQINFESESANGRFLLSSEKALVKVYKTFTNEGLCITQKSEILLKSIQMHVCQLDVDPNAPLQWLHPDRSGKLVSPNESVLHSVFDPCSVSLNLFQEGEYFEIDIDLASITLALDSREFEILVDIISRVALSPFPKASKKVSLCLLGSDMLRITKLDRFASFDQLELFKNLNRKAFEELNNILYVLTISKRQDEFTSGTTGICCPEALYLKEQLKDSMKLVLKEKKSLVGDLLKLEQKAKSQATTINKQTKVSLKLKTVRWSLCKDRKVFLEATLQDCNFSRIRYEDFSGITRFQIGDATCNASIVDKDSKLSKYEVLRLWNPSKKYDSVPFIHIYLVASGESHGLSMFELCDITLHPLDIHLAQKTASELQKYFFNRTLSTEERHILWSHIGSPLPRDKTDASGRESEPVHVEELQGSPMSTPKLSHKHSVSWDLRTFPNLDVESEQKHTRSISTDLDNTWKTATEYLLEDEEDDEDDSSGILSILNQSFPLSPTDGKLNRQNSLEAERGIALDKLRMNELGLQLSFESKVLNVADMKLYLDTFDYLRYKGTWQELMEKVKWNIIKSVLKNMAGFQTGKIRGFTSSMNPRAILKKKKKSIFKSLFAREGPQEDKSQHVSGDTSASPSQTTGEEEEKANPEYYEEKGKLLMGNRYTKNV